MLLKKLQMRTFFTKESSWVFIGNNLINILFCLFSVSTSSSYKNNIFRIVCILLSLPLISDKLAKKINLNNDTFKFISTTFNLAFFFSYMTLKNGFSSTWLVSWMLCIVMMISIYNLIGFLSSLLVGSTIAYLFFKLQGNFIWINPGEIKPASYVTSLLYAAIVGGFFAARKNKHELNKIRKNRVLVSSAIAHEIRNSMKSLELNLHILREKLPPFLLNCTQCKQIKEKSQIQLSNLMTKALNRAANDLNSSFSIIDRILTIFKFDKKPNVELKLISINDVIRASIESYGLSENEKKLIKTNLKNNFYLEGDFFLIKHVFLNLIKNALYYVKKANKGSIEINTEIYQDNFFKVVFKDTGQGIKKEDLPLIFTEEFTNTPYGFGMGLNFCKKVITLMKGIILCDSEYEVYTTFTIIFPRFNNIT